MATGVLPEFSMLLAVPVLLMADDANFLVVIDVLGLGVVVDAIVDFIGPPDKLFCIQLNVTGANRTSVASEYVLGCHPELTVLLADDGDLINSRRVFDF